MRHQTISTDAGQRIDLAMQERMIVALLVMYVRLGGDMIEISEEEYMAIASDGHGSAMLLDQSPVTGNITVLRGNPPVGGGMDA